MCGIFCYGVEFIVSIVVVVCVNGLEIVEFFFGVVLVVEFVISGW